MAITGPFRVSFFWTQQADRLGGWSENFWNNLTSFSAAQTAALALQTALWNSKGNGVLGPYIRISQVGNFRSAQVINTNLTSTATGASSDADYPTTALLLFLASTQPYFSRQWLRGNPDNQVSSGGHFTPTAGYVTLINAITNILVTASNGWVLRNLNQGSAKQLITAVTLAGVVTVPAHGFATGNTIRISRTGGIPGLNALWKITVIDSNTFQLVGVPVGGFTGGYTKPGTAQLQSFIYQAITGGGIARASKHNVGRPFGQLTGRRRRRSTTGS